MIWIKVILKNYFLFTIGPELSNCIESCSSLRRLGDYVANRCECCAMRFNSSEFSLSFSLKSDVFVTESLGLLQGPLNQVSFRRINSEKSSKAPSNVETVLFLNIH